MNYYVVCDVGGSSIKYALMDEEGTFLEKSSVPTPAGLDEFTNQIGEIVTEYKQQKTISGIALSLPGAVDVERGHVEGASAVPYIHGPNIRDLIEQRTNLRVELENDANCAGLAEGWIGAAKDIQDYVCVIIGTGIGGALVLNKEIRHGKHLHGGEFGYMILNDYLDEPLGKSWSALGATGALVRQVSKRKGVEPNTLDGKKIFELEEAGDAIVVEEVDKFIKCIATGILNLQYIIDPEKILIGGAISSREDFVDRINEKLRTMQTNMHRLLIQVEKCQFGNDSNLIGALYHFLQRRDKNAVEVRNDG